MPEDYYGEDGMFGYEAPLSYIEQMYDLPAATSDEGALPAAASPVDLGDWSLENFQKQFMQGDPAKADAAAKWLAAQAAQGKEYVYDPNQKDLAYQMQMNSAVPLMSSFGGPSYANFDPNNPAASMGEVFRFDIDKNKGTAPVVLGEGQNYVLTDAKGEKVLGRASTAEEMRALMDAANAQKYGWNLYQGNEQGGYTKGGELFGESDPRVGGVLGALVQYGLPIGLSLIPGVGWAGSAALAGAGSTAGKLISGYDLDDALKAGLITAGTAGLLKAPVLGGGGSIGGTIGSALESVPGVGDALRGVSDALAGGGSNAGAQAAADALANEIVVTGIKSATPALISGAAGSLLGSAALNNVLGNTLINTPIEQAVNQTPQTVEEQFDDILVKGGRLPANAGAAVSGAAPAVVGNLPSAPQGPLSQEQVTQEQPAEVADENEIVVTGDTTPLDLGGLPSGVISSLPPSLVTDITGAAQGPLSQEQVTQEQPAEVADENEIVVTGDTAPLDLSGALSNLVNTVAPSLTTPLENLAVKATEQPTGDTAEEGWEVEGKTETPLPVTTPVSTGNGSTPQGPLSQETPADTAEEGWEVEGKTETPLPVTTPVSTGNGSTYDQVANEIVVTKTPPKTLDDIAASTVAAVAPSLTTPLEGAPPTTTTETKAEDKGGLSTADKLRLALAALGAIGGGVGGGSGGGATIPSGFGRRDPIYSAKLPTPGQNGAFAVGGLGGSTLPMPAGGDLTQFGMGNATRAAPTQIPQYGGVNPPGFNTQTWDWLGPQQTVAKDIMDQLAVLPSSAAPVAAPAAEPVEKAMGGYAVGGPGDGRSDEIPALLSDGEYVIDAETVALLGNGSSKAGAQQLDKFRANIRKHKGRQLARGKFSVKAKQPSAYLSGGR